MALALPIVLATCAFASPPTARWPHRLDWRASTFTASAQAEAVLDVDHFGNLTVAWSSRRQQDGRSGVYLQRFNPSGYPIGLETQANAVTGTHHISPAISNGLGDTMWLAWQAHAQDQQLGSIVARRFTPNATGQFVGGAEIVVNQFALGDQTAPVIAASDDGTIAVAWTSFDGANAHPRVCIRLIDSDGQPLTDEFTLASSLGPITTTPALAVGTDGAFGVAYAVFDASHTPVGLAMQRFDVCGKLVGAEMVVAHDCDRTHIEPVLAAAPDGWIIAWCEAEASGEDYDIAAQRLALDGLPLANPFIVNSARNGLQNAPAIASLPNGQFVIAWNDVDKDGPGIMVQRFDASGRAIEAAEALTEHANGAQALRAAAAVSRIVCTGSGDLLVAWHGDADKGDYTAANVTLLTATLPESGFAKRGILQEGVPAVEPVNLQAVAMAQLPGPHEPPVFDRRLIDDRGEREVQLGANEIGFTGILSTGWTPPDPSLAVGENHLVAVTNGAIAFFDKAGTLLFQDQIEGAAGFWGAQGATNFVFDPEALYDPLSDRFFAMASETITAQARSFILIAVSDDGDPNGLWHKYRVETTALAGTTYDSPNLAVDNDVVYITGDVGGGAIVYPVFTFNKAAMLAGGPIVIAQSGTMPTGVESAGIPPVSFDSPPALYLIEHQEGASNTQVRLIALTNALSGPLTFTSHLVTVPAYGPPEDPPQAGTTVRPEAFEARFWSVAYRNGSLWATHHINANRVLARWYEFAMNGWPTSGQTPTLVQSGNIDPGGTTRTFFSAITVDDFGNAAMTFAQSSPTQFISMQTTYRDASDPLGTFQAPVQRKINTGPYTTNRWGDYAGVNVDPADGLTMWAHHEWAMGNSWRTWIQSFYPGNPCPPDINLNGVVDVDDLLAVINAWGVCDSCPEDIAPPGGNSTVDVDDLLLVINNWGSCP